MPINDGTWTGQVDPGQPHPDATTADPTPELPPAAEPTAPAPPPAPPLEQDSAPPETWPPAE